VLDLIDITVSDVGNYSCVAVNRVGSDSKVAILESASKLEYCRAPPLVILSTVGI